VRLTSCLFAALLLLSLTPRAASAQATHVAVIVGLAGEPEHAELFQRWGATLVDGLTKRGVDPAHVVYLSERPEADATRMTGRSSKAAVESALGAIAARAGGDDLVFVMLIGHGTFDGKQAKFNLPGPDMTPADFAPLLAKMKAKQVVLVNATSASGPFLEALAAPGRTIVTATRSGAEKFSTLFGGYFVDALTSEAADADKNSRISVLEAFTSAKREVARAYEREGIMLTEHPLLDDSGKGPGTGDPTADGAVGRVASIVTLGNTTAAEPLPDDPALRALYQERRELEKRVETLRLLKNGMDPAKYAAELEKLVTDLALKSRQIREREGRQ
jgi:hypothetical protein